MPKLTKKTSELTNKENTLLANSNAIDTRAVKKDEHSSLKFYSPLLIKNSYTEGQPTPLPTYLLLCSIFLPPWV